jgi:signal transduction histidine kinase
MRLMPPPRWWLAGTLAAALAAAAPAAEDGWLGLFSRELRALDAERERTRLALEALGAPVIGQTAPQFGHQHQRLAQPPLTPPWVQVDLQEEVPIDRIALIPAVLDWQADTKRTYGFPPRFRIDLSASADFTEPVRVADFTERDQPDPGVAPLVVRVDGRRARFVRVTVTKLAEEAKQHFYAIGELMVLSGRRNVAVGRPVTASSAMNLPPRWTLPNLVDGRTALGPPISVELLPWDGLFAGATTTEPFTWMAVDLGAEQPLQEIRLYATHARLGADIPGFSFPSRFRVQAARSADFSDAVTVLDATGADYPNPGDNPVTIRTPGVVARHVRVALPPGNQGRFGLSEIEVYADDRNVARGATVTSTPDPSGYSNKWPRSLLVDGFTSYGRLKELPDWLDGWDQRAHLAADLAALDGQRQRLLADARVRAWWSGGAAAALVALVVAAWLVALRRRRARELEQLRRRLARDLHDEIGSNLAAIARLSELGAAEPGAAAGDWQEVNRIAHESVDGMREVLWLAGAREEAGPDLASHLRRLVERMLGGLEVRWTAPLEALPASWSPAARREVFLLIKEALTNIVRHAQARSVELGLAIAGGELRLEIRDDGRGFDPAVATGGMGLASVRERARALGGRLAIDSAPGRGTRIALTVPVARLAAAGAGSSRVPAVGRGP